MGVSVNFNLSQDFAWVLTQEPVNAPPEFSSTPILVVAEGSAYSYTPTALDADYDAVTITAQTLPIWMTFNGGVLTGSPTANEVGSHPVVLIASDGVNSTPQSFTIVVGAAVEVSLAPIGRVVTFDESATVKEKDPDSLLDYWFCLGGLIGADLISSFSIVTDDALTVSQSIISSTVLVDDAGGTHAAGTVVTLWVAGGTIGEQHRLTVRYTTESGRIDDRSITLFIVDKKCRKSPLVYAASLSVRRWLYKVSVIAISTQSASMDGQGVSEPRQAIGTREGTAANGTRYERIFCSATITCA